MVEISQELHLVHDLVHFVRVEARRGDALHGHLRGRVVVPRRRSDRRYGTEAELLPERVLVHYASSIYYLPRRQLLLLLLLLLPLPMMTMAASSLFRNTFSAPVFGPVSGAILRRA